MDSKTKEIIENNLKQYGISKKEITIENYNKKPSYVKKNYFEKLKYQFPSLGKYNFSKFSRNLSSDIKSPLYEDNSYFNKKNSHLFISKNILLDNNKINKKLTRNNSDFQFLKRNKKLNQNTNRNNNFILLYKNYKKENNKNERNINENLLKKKKKKKYLQNNYFVRNISYHSELFEKINDLNSKKKEYNTIEFDDKNCFQKINQIHFIKNNINNKKTIYKGFNTIKFEKFNRTKSNKYYHDIIRTERIVKKLLYD